MPAFTSSPDAAKPASKLTYTFAPSLLKAKSHISSLPAIPPQVGALSRTYRSRVPAKLATVSLVGRRDQAKNAPNVFFEEKEDENFASKTEVKVMFYIFGITLLSFIIYVHVVPKLA